VRQPCGDDGAAGVACSAVRSGRLYRRGLHPSDYRGRGLASACFDDAVAKAFRDNVDIMIVSGNRNLYRMRGCLRVGDDSAFALGPEAATALAQQVGVSVTVEAMQAEELALVMDCYRAEPVRFVRPLEDYRHALQCAMVMNRFSDFLVLREQGAFRAISSCSGLPITLGSSPGEKDLHRGVFPATAAYSWRRCRRSFGAIRSANSGGRSRAMIRSFAVLRTGRTDATRVPGAGNHQAHPLPATDGADAPRFEELLGWKEAALLSFRQREVSSASGLGDAELVTDRDTATRLVFGTIEGTEAEVMEGHGRLAEALQTIFPLPCLWYGINYV